MSSQGHTRKPAAFPPSFLPQGCPNTRLWITKEGAGKGLRERLLGAKAWKPFIQKRQTPFSIPMHGLWPFFISFSFSIDEIHIKITVFENVYFSSIQYICNVVLFKFQDIFIIPKENPAPMSGQSPFPFPGPQQLVTGFPSLWIYFFWVFVYCLLLLLFSC